MWRDLRNVIRIEVSDRPAAPLVSPQQSFFLRENLRLRLLSARLALLSRDERAFKADLDAAASWLEQYFDPQSEAGAGGARHAAHSSRRRRCRAKCPTSRASLDAVRSLKAVADRTPERAAARASSWPFHDPTRVQPTGRGPCAR